jgi:hypothetical protein
MGQAIYYCFRCSKQLRDVHLDQGKAYKIAQSVCCAECAPEAIRSLPPDQVQLLLKEISGRGKKASSPAIATPRPARSSQVAPIRSSSKLPLIGAALGGVGLVILAAVLMSGGHPAPPPPEPEKRPPPPKAVVATKKPEASPLDDVRRYAREQPDDLEGQIKRFEDLAFANDQTSVGAEARKEVEALRARERGAIERDMATLEREIAGPIAAEAFADVLRSIETARHRQRGSQWKLAIEKRIREVEDRARVILAPIKAQAADAKAKGRTADLDVLARRVRAWGLSALSEELAKAVEAVEGPPPPPPPTSADAKLYAAAWEKAVATRDYAAAAATLEKLALTEAGVVEERAKDVRELKELAKLYPELLAGIVNGKPRFLSFGDKAGRVLFLDAERVELSYDPQKPTTFHEWRDIPLLTILALAKHHGIPADLVARLDERMPKPTSDELKAREVFYQAERDFREMTTRGKALAAYALLKNGPFAKRARERSEEGLEYPFAALDLAFGGSFGPTNDGKLLTTRDTDNWIEAEYYGRPSTAYRCWVLAGGCCAEAFEFSYQATGLTETDPKTKKKASAEPGGPVAAPLKASIRGLKSPHPPKEPKAPARWEWVEVPLAKVVEGGAKRVRLITSEPGVGIKALVVSATLKKPPADAELAELAKKSEGTSKGAPVVTLDDFEQDPMPWGFVGGQEFPGAKGDLAIDGALAVGGRRSIRLRGDFSGGGAYVGTWRNWVPPAGWDARELRIWMKAEGVSRIGIRIVDGSDQCHQKNHGVELQPTSEWQEVVLKIADMVGGQHWGGANDAKWHPGFKGFGINMGNDTVQADTRKGTLWIDDVRATLDPIP